jgi:cytochrome c-type protein NapC
MEWTNREEFCISCHEMQINYDEYQESAHDVNRVGVKATCPDCHVPKAWGPKVLAKIRASKDLYHHLLGTLDSPEKYQNERLHMAERVWQFMKETDSQTCRNCHDVDSMDFEQQQGRARRKHKKLTENGKTCIDCHKGIAHELPDGFEADQV